MHALTRALVLLLLLATPAWAIVGIDSTSTSGAQTSVTQFNWAHTLSTGLSRALFVGVSHVRGGGQSTTVSSITCGAQSLTLVPNSRSVDPITEGVTELWYLAAPTASCTITVTLAANVGGAVGGAVVFTGVNQATPVGTAGIALGAGTAASVIVPSAVGGMTIAVVSENTFSGVNGVTTVAGTQRWSASVGTSTMSGAGSTLDGVNGNATHTWTLANANDRWAASGVVVLAATGTDTVPPSIPTGVVCTAVGSSDITCTWPPSTDNVGVVRYHVRQCTGTACVPTTEVSAPTTNTYSASGLTPNTVYRFTVQADDGQNLSSESAIAPATTLAVTECNLAWTDNATTEDSQIIRYCDTTGSTCTPSATLTTVAANVTTYKDTVCAQPVRCYDVIASLTGTLSTAAPKACTTTTTPVLSVSPPTMVFVATVGGSNPTAQALTITNGTPSTMNWAVAKNQAWISSVTPSSGTNTTVATVTVSISGLSAGTFDALLTVSAPGATNNPTTVPVQLQLSPTITPTSGRGGRLR